MLGMKTFGEIIGELRRNRGLTQKLLAAQIKNKTAPRSGWPISTTLNTTARSARAGLGGAAGHGAGCAMKVPQFYAGWLPAKNQRELTDPSHERIVAADGAFLRELDKKRGN